MEDPLLGNKPDFIETITDIPGVPSYLQRIGAEATGLLRATVKQRFGKYWRDVAFIRFNRSDGTVNAPEEMLPSNEEQKLIAAGFIEATAGGELPRQRTFTRGQLDVLNCPVSIADPDVYNFEDEFGDIIMLQVRREINEIKRYIPLTYWSDGRWRWSEPEGKLPLWGLKQLQESSTVFLHEGASSAQRLIKLLAKNNKGDHPWQVELEYAAHLGWIGGALNPYKTNWSPLAKNEIKLIYIVADNDDQGKDAVKAISKQVPSDAVVISVQFSDEWPPGFDLGDPFPMSMYGEEGRDSIYCGPPFKSCLVPATWATQAIPKKDKQKGRTTYECTPGFLRSWSFVSGVQEAVSNIKPSYRMTKSAFNDFMRNLSHAADTYSLLAKNQSERIHSFVYRPDRKERVVNISEPSINVYEPSGVQPLEGDPSPWLDFMKMMFPDPTERKHMFRWCATLIARPGTRMEWSVLLVADPGIGKTTLGMAVLTPLVGVWNTSVPGENDLKSEFNEWIAYKVLAVVNEIYSGQGWKMYHQLKAAVTDREITVNRKHRRQHQCDNWIHILACSNNSMPIRVDIKDRRWYFPDMAKTTTWGRSHYHTFRNWLSSGGLRIIQWWAENWEDYVLPGEHAPMTVRKSELVGESIAAERKHALMILGSCVDAKYPAAINSRQLRKLAAESIGKKFTRIPVDTFIQDMDFFGIGGIYKHHERWSNGVKILILCNDKAKEMDKDEIWELSNKPGDWAYEW